MLRHNTTSGIVITTAKASPKTLTKQPSGTDWQPNKNTQQHNIVSGIAMITDKECPKTI